MSQSNVVNLLDRASVMVDGQQLGEWLVEWAKAIASGEYGEVRTAMIVIETPRGIAQVHQSTCPSDRARIVGLLQGLQQEVWADGAKIHELREEER